MDNKKIYEVLNDFKLYEVDVPGFTREVDVAKHLPQSIIGKGAEFQQIRKINNYELTLLWKQLNRIMKNLYIHLASEEGLKAYEEVIGGDIEGDLEERRKKIYALWNLVRAWTHRTLEDWLDDVVGVGNYDMEIVYNEYEIFFDINIHQSNISLAWLGRRLRDIVPANLVITIRARINNDLVLEDKLTNWFSPLYKTGTELWHSGQIYNQAFIGELIQEEIILDSNTQIPEQHVYVTNEIYTGEVANDTR